MDQIVGFLKTLGPAGLIMIVLGIIYKVIPDAWLADRGKTLIAVLAGVAAGIVFLCYHGAECTFPNVADYIVYGIKEGLTAIGFFKTLQAVGVYTPPGK